LQPKNAQSWAQVFLALTPSVKRTLVWQFFLPGKALGPGRPKITSPWPLDWGGTSFGNAPALGLYPKEYPLNSWGYHPNTKSE